MVSRKRNRPEKKVETSQYPHVPKDAVNIGSYDPKYSYRIIHRTTSDAWGPPAIAEARSLVETVSDENLHLMRTHHPGLASAETVHLASRDDNCRFWHLVMYSAPPAYTHAGGLEVHLQPRGYIQPRLGISILQVPLTYSFLDPRRLLSEDDLNAIRDNFPHSIGAELLMVGHIVILYASMYDFHKDEYLFSGEVSLISNMVIHFRLFEITPSNTTLVGSALICANDNENCALGLRLKLPSGESAITTVTHGFVYRKGLGQNTITNTAAAISNWAYKVCHKLFYGTPVPRLPLLLSQIGTLSPLNLSLGKTVRLFKDRSVVGTITQTYDTPSRLLPYPVGYTHDLSLITGHNLPKVNAPPGLPRIIGWASIREVLDGASIFACAYLVEHGNNAEEGWGVHCGVRMPQSDPAVLQGMQYLWDATGGQSIAFIWRTVQAETPELGGYSGTVLCVGNPAAPEARAVAFQNFSVPYIPVSVGDGFSLGIHGGFILPEVIYQSAIECGETEPSMPGLQTYPLGHRSSHNLTRS